MLDKSLGWIAPGFQDQRRFPKSLPPSMGTAERKPTQADRMVSCSALSPWRASTFAVDVAHANGRNQRSHGTIRFDGP
jgi:hypothetical protein